ncbi:MAG: hypothetical protein N4A45_03120 [Flavobacteriales bacterium]|jgi:hypothetical protein|nr:hypothetical protein [Flavobacteriales bacterium]
MKPVIKQLLSDMIYFDDKRECSETDKYIKNAYDNLGYEITFTRIRNLLSWLNPKILTDDVEKYLIYEDFMEPEIFMEVYAEFKSLLDHIPVFKELFQLKEKHIEFNSSLTKDDIQEIKTYVGENSVLYQRRYYKPR